MVPMPDVPPLSWLRGTGVADVNDRGELSMVAPSGSDWFNDPTTPTRLSSAPALVVDADADFQFSAEVTVDFTSTFDAGVLFVHRSDDAWAKLCFELSTDHDPTVVSVVTRGVSDDANGPVIDGGSVQLRVSKMGPAFAFHHRPVGSDRWRLTRLFALDTAPGPVRVGLMAQSPTGAGCTCRFADVRYEASTLADPRDGS